MSPEIGAVNYSRPLVFLVVGGSDSPQPVPAGWESPLAGFVSDIPTGILTVRKKDSMDPINIPQSC